MDIPGKILIIGSHSSQGSQGPAGEPGIQVSYLTKLSGTANPACLHGGNFWKTVLISNCFALFQGPRGLPGLPGTPGTPGNDVRTILSYSSHPNSPFLICTCTTMQRFEHGVSVFRELQGKMESQVCQAPQVTRYVNRLCLIYVSLNTPRSQTAYQASFAVQTN